MRRRVAALHIYVHYRNIQIDSGRRDAGGAAVCVCEVDGVQFAVHVVRHGVCVSWRDEDECGRGDGTGG